MSRIRILVCRVDDASPDHMTGIAAVDLPQLDPAALAAQTALDTLEATTTEVGHTVLRAALQAQWAAGDAQLVAAYCRRFPVDQIRRDGHKEITVASRLGPSACRGRCSAIATPAHTSCLATRRCPVGCENQDQG